MTPGPARPGVAQLLRAATAVLVIAIAIPALLPGVWAVLGIALALFLLPTALMLWLGRRR